MEFSRPEYWSGYLFPSPGDLPKPGIELRSPALQANSLLAEPQESEVAQPCPTLRLHDCSLPAPLPVGFSRQAYWNGTQPSNSSLTQSSSQPSILPSVYPPSLLQTPSFTHPPTHLPVHSPLCPLNHPPTHHPANIFRTPLCVR